MADISKTIQLMHSDSMDAFSDSEQKLIEAAHQAIKSAYAPYSKFRVGASILLDDGSIITGSNQENAAFPSGLCAERVALNTCGHSNADRKIIAMVVTAESEHYKIPEILSPCGGCLQVMADFVNRQQQDFKIILSHPTSGFHVANGVSTFLPFGFELKS